MQLRKLLPLATILAAVVIFCRAQTPIGSAEDEAAIREILARFEQAFEKRDASLYAMSFVEDADWENAFGGREKGRANIEKRLRGVYQMFQQSKQTIREVRICFIKIGRAHV